jgi:hypothetical protein
MVTSGYKNLYLVERFDGISAPELCFIPLTWSRLWGVTRKPWNMARPRRRLGQDPRFLIRPALAPAPPWSPAARSGEESAELLGFAEQIARIDWQVQMGKVRPAGARRRGRALPALG